MSRRLKRILIAVTCSIALIIWQFSNLVGIWHSFHTITPTGEKIQSKQQIKEDLSYLFRWKVYVDEVDVFPNNISHLLSDKTTKIFEPYVNGNHYQVILSGHHYYQDKYPEGLLPVVARYGVETVKYLLDRQVEDTSINIVRVSFQPRIFLELGGGQNLRIAIPIDEFIKLREQFRQDGLNDEQIDQKLVDYFLKNVEI